MTYSHSNVSFLYSVVEYKKAIHALLIQYPVPLRYGDIIRWKNITMIWEGHKNIHLSLFWLLFVFNVVHIISETQCVGEGFCFFGLFSSSSTTTLLLLLCVRETINVRLSTTQKSEASSSALLLCWEESTKSSREKRSLGASSPPLFSLIICFWKAPAADTITV